MNHRDDELMGRMTAGSGRPLLDKSDRPASLLTQIAEAMKQMSYLNDRIQGFVDRTVGTGPGMGEEDEKTSTSSYANDLGALRYEITRLNELVNNLETIG